MMKASGIFHFVFILSGCFWLSLSAALANLGETFSEITARYGQPKRKLADSKINDRAINAYRFEFNGRMIFVEFMNGKSASEAIRASKDVPHFAEATCLAIAAEISGRTNWAVLKREQENVIWITDDANANWERRSDGPDFLFVTTREHFVHQLQVENGAVSGAPRPDNRTRADTKAVEARVLKWQQELAEEGNAYGEYQMGLRYRDGNGVPRDLNKAREWLKKAADQGDTDAASLLANLTPPNKQLSPGTDAVKVAIHSAEFGMGQSVADVTEKVSELLRGPNDGFIADAKTLGSDPLPGKKKQLVIRYDYSGTNYVLKVPGASRVTYRSLERNAIK
jgi:hypothetical protein